MRGRGLSSRPLLAKSRSVGQTDVEPAVVIVVEKRNPATLRFDDVALVIRSTPDVRGIESSLASYIDKLHRRRRIRARCCLKNKAAPPLPDGCGQGIDQC